MPSSSVAVAVSVTTPGPGSAVVDDASVTLGATFAATAAAMLTVDVEADAFALS